MKDLSEFITVHPHFSVFLVIAVALMVGAIADGIKGRAPRCGPCAVCRAKAKKREEAS